MTKDAAEVSGDGQTLNGANKRTGFRNRRFRRDWEYHLVPTCLLKDVPSGDSAPPFPASRKPYRPPSASVFMESPVNVQIDRPSSKEDTKGTSGQSLFNNYRFEWAICGDGCGQRSGFGCRGHFGFGVLNVGGTSQRNFGQ